MIKAQYLYHQLEEKHGISEIRKDIDQLYAIGRGIMPDIKINYTLADYLAKKDLEMDWVLKDIEKNR